MKTYEYLVSCKYPDGSKFLQGVYKTKKEAQAERGRLQKSRPQNHYYMVCHVYASSWKDRDVSNWLYGYNMETGERIKF